MTSDWLCIHVKDVVSAMRGDAWLSRNVSTFDNPFSSLIQPLRMSSLLRQIPLRGQRYFTNGIYGRSSLPAKPGSLEVFVDNLNHGSQETTEIAVLAYRPVLKARLLSAVVVVEVRHERAQEAVDRLAREPWASDNPVLLPRVDGSDTQLDADLRRREEMWLTAVAFAQSAAFEGSLSRSVADDDPARELVSLQRLYREVREATRTLWWPFASYQESLQEHYVKAQEAMGSRVLHQEAMDEIHLLEAGARSQVLELERNRQKLAADVRASQQELEQRREKRIAWIASVFTVLAGLLGLGAMWVSVALETDPVLANLIVAGATAIVVGGIPTALWFVWQTTDVKGANSRLSAAETRLANALSAGESRPPDLLSDSVVPAGTSAGIEVDYSTTQTPSSCQESPSVTEIPSAPVNQP